MLTLLGPAHSPSRYLGKERGSPKTARGERDGAKDSPLVVSAKSCLEELDIGGLPWSGCLMDSFLLFYVGFLVDFLVNLKESMRHPDYSSCSKIGSSCALVRKCTSGYNDEQMDDRCKILNASHPGPSN